MIYGSDFTGPLLPGDLRQGTDGRYVVNEPTFLPGGPSYSGNPYTDPAFDIQMLLNSQKAYSVASQGWGAQLATVNGEQGRGGLALLGLVGVAVLLLMRRR